MDVREIADTEFTKELVGPVFRDVYDRAPGEENRLDLDHFSSTWRGMMKVGFARAWAIEVDGKTIGLLGALFVEDLFTGLPTAMAMFWFVLTPFRGVGAGHALWKCFEAEARRLGCRTIWGGSTKWSFPEVMKERHRKNGLELNGSNYRKVL
jgi:hypothetical protein